MNLEKISTKFRFLSFPTARYGLGALKNRFRDLTDTKTYEVRTLQSCFVYRDCGYSLFIVFDY